jgi:hypothetical protein
MNQYSQAAVIKKPDKDLFSSNWEGKRERDRK